MKETKTLIVTETLRYEFAVPASMAEDRDVLIRYFGSHPDPWGGATFAAVTERDFEIQAHSVPRGSIPDPQTARQRKAR